MALATVQRNIETAARKVAHHTKAEREQITIMSTPENVRLREEAAARCTAKIKRKVLKKPCQEHLVKCCLQPGEKKTKRKPLTEGHFTEDRDEWRKELQRYCEEVHTHQEDTKEVQESRIDFFQKKRNQQFTEDGRSAEITVDLVLQARAKLSDNRVNGPEDAIVSEMIRKLPMEKDLHYCEVFSETFHGPGGISKFVEDRETGLLEGNRTLPRRKGSDATEQ